MPPSVSPNCCAADVTDVFAVVLAGGRGERLWPLARQRAPKPLLRIRGRTLLHATLERVAALGIGRERTLVVGSREHAAELQAEAPGAHLVLEPAAGDTARAVALSALAALRVEGDPILWVLPSDHLVADPEPVVTAVRTAVAAARSHGLFFVFGTPAKDASTDYGWLLPGVSLHPAYSRLDEYVEKPDAATASRIHAGGQHLWNCGMFVLPARALLEAMRRLQPGILFAAERVAAGDAGEDTSTPRLSLDHAILEPATREGLCGIVPLDYPRLDLGRLDGLAGLLEHDARDNAVAGDVFAIDTARCMLLSDGTTLAALGLDDLIVIAERGVVLICARDRASEVKRIVAELSARGRKDLL